MRVGLIGPVPPWLGGSTPGGVATHQFQLAHGLADAGMDVALLATNVSELQASEKAGAFPMYTVPPKLRIEARGVPDLARYVLRVGLSTAYGSRRELLRNLVGYAAFVEQVRPDLLHVQHPLERCTYARMVRSIHHLQVPLIVTAHSLFGEHADSTIRELMAPNLRAADRVIAVGEHIAEQAEQLGVEPRRINVIHSGVDSLRFRPGDRVAARQRLGVEHEAKVVLFVGNLEPRKQVDVLLRAIAGLRGRVPNVLLLVVGSGKAAGVQNQTARLVRLTGELGLQQCVRFVGRLGDDELLQAYAAADVFALPSSSEAQGIVALEAMACGLAVVASAVGGLVGTIEDGVSGCLVDSGDVDALAERLARLLCDAERRAAMGAAARRAVEQRFAWHRTIKATVEVYHEVLACASR